MAAKGTRVTPSELKKMWLLYQQLGSYAAVARKMRRSPDTVSRHMGRLEAAQKVATVLR